MKKVVITDYQFDDVNIERQVLNRPDIQVYDYHYRDPEKVLEVARDADALIIQMAKIPADLIERSKSREFSVRPTVMPSFSGAKPYSSGISVSEAGGFSQKPRVTAAPAGTYRVGDTVAHKAFGTGMIVSATQMANDTLLEVAFDKVGTKKLFANFARLTKL